MYIIRTSIDNKILAQIIATRAIKEKLAASAHIRDIDSIYYWNNILENKKEYEIEMLTNCPKELEKLIKEIHTYILPEIIILKIDGSKEFINWVQNSCK